jgi:predicted nucleic acid-binding protein
VYFDTAYIAKFYLNEPGSPRIRELVRKTDSIHSSWWAWAELQAVFHRNVREGCLLPDDARTLAARFASHVEKELWILHPVTEGLLRRATALLLSSPNSLFIRTADAVHLTTAREIGEIEVWTNDRHMLAAAAFFGLSGRSV